MKETTDNIVMTQKIDEIKKDGNDTGPRTGTTALTGFMKQFTHSGSTHLPPKREVQEQEVTPQREPELVGKQALTEKEKEEEEIRL